MLGDALTAAGYFGAADAERERFLRGDTSTLWHVPRCVDGMGEPMNELDPAKGLSRCTEALHRIGVHVSIGTREDQGWVIDGSPVSFPEFEDATDAAVAMLEKLDELCARAGVRERAYFADVSDGVVLFLTPEMLRVFEESDLLPSWQRPWRTGEEREAPPSDPWLRLERSWLGGVSLVLLFVLGVALVIGGVSLLVWLTRFLPK